MYHLSIEIFFNADNIPRDTASASCSDPEHVQTCLYLQQQRVLPEEVVSGSKNPGENYVYERPAFFHDFVKREVTSSYNCDSLLKVLGFYMIAKIFNRVIKVIFFFTLLSLYNNI